MNKDNYNGEKEIWMQLQESADKFRAETVGKRLFLLGGVGESFIFSKDFDCLYLSIYADLVMQRYMINDGINMYSKHKTKRTGRNI